MDNAKPFYNVWLNILIRLVYSQSPASRCLNTPNANRYRRHFNGGNEFKFLRLLQGGSRNGNERTRQQSNDTYKGHRNRINKCFTK